ncbi:MAG: T9SS type A sorting domain-containing protein [bacterium]|nr:T9SS type A sorting domain-containing protein [bacterium]
MKKLLLSLVAVVTGFTVYGQVVVAGVSPAAIQGNYDFTTQANCGAWPGETDDGTWGVLNNLDFNVAGTFIQDTLRLVEDGTPGTNPQGNPISQEGCDSIINDLTSFIAVIYRNSCNFTTKLLNAQNAGAVAAIIVNREDALLGMLGDAVEGIQVEIPAVFISSIDGAALISEMANGPVEMFIGNKIGAFPNDFGAVKGEFLIAPYGGNNVQLFDGFTPGLQAYNYGINDLPNATITATIDGPAGNYYTETLNFNALSGDTVFPFPGNATEFPAWTETSYDLGNYTLTYTLDAGVADDFPFDNVYTAEFSINDDILSASRLDVGVTPTYSNYPSNATTEYQSCWMVQEPSMNGMIVDGMWIVGHADTSVNVYAGQEIFVNAYQWDDGWVDLNDPNYDFAATTTNAFNNLNLLTFGTYYPASDNDVDQPSWVQFQTAITLQNDVRYLFCAQTFSPDVVSFGYDNGLDYGANYSIFAQPVSPVNTDGTWYVAGWNGSSAPSMALTQTYAGMVDPAILQGSAFPNPANDHVTVSVNASGDANMEIVDVTGKVVFSAPVTLENGQATVNINGFDSGVYVINVTTNEGQTGTFSVVKQ